MFLFGIFCKIREDKMRYTLLSHKEVFFVCLFGFFLLDILASSSVNGSASKIKLK